MLTFQHFLLVIAVLLQGQISVSELNCDRSRWNLETLVCRAVGEKKNYILTRNKQSDVADTTLTGTFQNVDWGKIKTVGLKNAKLLTLSPELFANASSLTNLDLSGNPDLCFSGEEFMYLGNLETLRLSGTGKCKGKSLLSKVPNLYSLDLSNVGVPFDIFSLTNLNTFNKLQIVDLSRNNAYNIDFTKFNVGGVLKSINVTETEVNLGDQCFETATNLRTVIMSNSKIRNLPKNTFKGTYITFLDLSHNFITADGVGSLIESMSFVNMSHNHIGDLFRPGVFKQGLETLDLSYNNITHLHVESFWLTNKLRTLNLAHNKLAWMYEKLFAEMDTIEELDLSYNLMVNFFDTFFTDLRRLETLNLAGNLLFTLDNSLFQNNALLENLNLRDNRLTTLNILTFVPLKRLKRLELSNNKLTRLPEDLLHVGDLNYFAVECNRLTYLSASFFKGKLGTAVSLHGNPWKCACLSPIISAVDVYDLRLDRKYFNDGNHPTCYVGDKNNYQCDDNTLSESDYSTWERTRKETGIKC